MRGVDCDLRCGTNAIIRELKCLPQSKRTYLQLAMLVNLTYVRYEAKFQWQVTEFWNKVWTFLRNIIFQHHLAQLKIIN